MFKSFITGLRIVDSISRPLRIYCDNSVAVFMAKNNKSGSQSKHIDIKYLAIKEHVKEKKVVIEHVSTELMIVDPLTKGMPPIRFKDLVDKNGTWFHYLICIKTMFMLWYFHILFYCIHIYLSEKYLYYLDLEWTWCIFIK